MVQQTHAVLLGGLILAKAQQSPEPTRVAVSHLRKHIQCIFAYPGDQTMAYPASKWN